jgi:hypothetical protein
MKFAPTGLSPGGALSGASTDREYPQARAAGARMHPLRLGSMLAPGCPVW